MRKAGSNSIALAALYVLSVTVADSTESLADRVIVSEPGKVLEDFELIDSNGKSVRFSTLRGRPAYVFFGFTRCPDVCHTALYKLKLLTQAAGPASHRPHVVMISVDGVNDTPRALRRFLRAYPSEFIGLTGDTDRLHQVAAQFSAASFPAMTKDRKGRYLVDHSAHIYLVDASGRLRATFFNPSVEAMARIGTQVLCRTAQVPVAGTGPPCIAATAFTIASPSP